MESVNHYELKNINGIIKKISIGESDGPFYQHGAIQVKLQNNRFDIYFIDLEIDAILDDYILFLLDNYGFRHGNAKCYYERLSLVPYHNNGRVYFKEDYVKTDCSLQPSFDISVLTQIVFFISFI